MGRGRGKLTSRTGAGVTATLLVASVCLCSREARADVDFQFAAGMSGGWLRRTPAFTARDVETSARHIGEGAVRTGPSLAMLGIGGDIELTIDDRWKLPLVGGNAWWTVGSYDTTVTSLDGSIAQVRPWSTFRGDVLLPGIGRRWKHRRNMWAAAVRSGLSFATMDGTVAAGVESVPLVLRATTFLVQVELEGCRRLDPTTRICLQVVPRLYEYELLNGLTFGLRMEWGQ
jgi:hypothetical protein